MASLASTAITSGCELAISISPASCFPLRVSAREKRVVHAVERDSTCKRLHSPTNTTDHEVNPLYYTIQQNLLHNWASDHLGRQ